MSLSRGLWATWLWAWAAVAFAAPSAELRLDVAQVTAGQVVGLQLVTSGGRPQGTPEIEAPAGLQLALVGQSQSTRVENGQIEQFHIFRYEVAALRAGRHTLGPASVRFVERGGKTQTVRAPPVRLRVEPPSDDGPGLPVEASASWNVPEAWQGQVAVLQLTVRSRLEHAGVRWFGVPEEGLLAPRDGRPVSERYQLQEGEGIQQFDHTYVPRVLTTSGDRRWEAPTAEVELVAERSGRGLFSMMQRTKRTLVTAEPLTLRVNPLPEPPEGFSGLVGSFTLQGDVRQRRVPVGRTVEQVLRLVGDGSLEGFSLPEPPDLEGARIYPGDQRPSASVVDGRYTSSNTFTRSIVPTRTGILRIPPVEIVVFDPEKGHYTTLKTAAAELTVVPGEDGDVDVTSFGEAPPEDVAVDAPEGLRPPWRGPARRLPWLEAFPAALGLGALPALALLGGVLRERLAAWRTARAEARPVRVATPSERLARLPDDPEARLTAQDAALRAALALATGLSDRDAALDALPDERSAPLRDLFSTLDRVRFAGQPAPDDLDARVAEAVAALEAA